MCRTALEDVRRRSVSQCLAIEATSCYSTTWSQTRWRLTCGRGTHRVMSIQGKNGQQTYGSSLCAHHVHIYQVPQRKLLAWLLERDVSALHTHMPLCKAANRSPYRADWFTSARTTTRHSVPRQSERRANGLLPIWPFFTCTNHNGCCQWHWQCIYTEKLQPSFIVPQCSISASLLLFLELGTLQAHPRSRGREGAPFRSPYLARLRFILIHVHVHHCCLGAIPFLGRLLAAQRPQCERC